MILFYIWLCMAASSMLVYWFPPIFAAIGQHGKFSDAIAVPSTNFFYSLWTMTVPKRWFTHMYIVGMVASAIALRSQFSLPLLLFSLHVMRRFLECIFMTHFGTSRMHIAGYLCGILHYVLVPITFVRGHYNSSPFDILWLILFALSSFFQWRVHKYFFAVNERREEDNGRKIYCLPAGPMFSLVCCPHYLAEILLYISLSLLVPSICTAALVLWVTSNLCVVGRNQYLWYERQFGDKATSKRWNAVIPYVWWMVHIRA